MAWGNCGTDSKGRPIGYLHPATCDHPGCEAKIDRGLSYACGGMHGETEYGCEGYFCGQHLSSTETVEGICIAVCDACLRTLVKEKCLCKKELDAYSFETAFSED